MVRKASRKKSGKCLFAVLLMITVIAVFVYRSNITSLKKQTYEIENQGEMTRIPLPKEEPYFTVSITPDKISSSNAILVRLMDDTVLMQKNSEEKVYPASLTKMMTVIVAIENLPDLNEKIILTGSMFDGLYEANASMAGFQPDEEVRAIDLLYGAMLPSGAECCIGLADHIAGSEEGFVELMNQKAEELGMNNTHFENTTGLHNDNHYTTVKDLAALLSYALKNDTFREIFTTFRHSIPPTNKHPGGITFYSTMYEKLGDQNILDGEILGGKTGYTEKAGLCLASLAKVGESEYILITTGAKGDHHTKQYNIIDAVEVYNSIIK